MAGRFTNPYPQFFDSTPNVYSGGTLTFYASGTSSLQNIYTDEDLTTPASNPLTLNSAGRPAVDVFLQDLDYKVVLKDSSGNTIWTADPVKARDSSYVAKTLTGSGSPNGSVAGTAGSSDILPDFYWDYTNSILYVCTTTGTSTTAVWTAVNASSATATVPPPQGRLTLVSGSPVVTSDQASKTAVYYTPFVGNLVPIYNGTTMLPTEFSELTLTLVSQHAANTIYDVFVFSNSGVVTIVTGPAWSVSSAGGGDRGSGASTTQLTRIKGLLVNAVQMTARNGSTTYTVAANVATYVGSILIDGTAGQVSCHTAYGQSRVWGVWNAYNRQPVYLKAGDSTASWSYTTNGYRSANNNNANSVTTLVGLTEEAVEFRYQSFISSGSIANNNSTGASIAIALNGSRVGTFGQFQFSQSSGGTINSDNQSLMAIHHGILAAGMNQAIAQESGLGVTGATFSGTESFMKLTAQYRA
jgi:hypothetical protein